MEVRNNIKNMLARKYFQTKKYKLFFSVLKMYKTTYKRMHNYI